MPEIVSDTDLLRDIIANLSRHLPSGDDYGTPLWAVVRDLTRHGKTMAARLCERLGFDPDVEVIRPDWPDPATEVVMRWCSVCEQAYGRDEGECPECAEEDDDAKEG